MTFTVRSFLRKQESHHKYRDPCFRGGEWIVAIVTWLCILYSHAAAFEFEPLQPLDTASVDPRLLKDVYGAWEIRSHDGKKTCRVTLLKEFGIGGYQIEVAPDCKKSFPVMDDIAAWRINEGWAIDFVDALRHARLRFETPDDRYVAIGDDKDIAGMEEFRKLPDKAK